MDDDEEEGHKYFLTAALLDDVAFNINLVPFITAR